MPPELPRPPRVFVLSAQGASIGVAGGAALFRRDLRLAGSPHQVEIDTGIADFALERRLVAGTAELPISGTADMQVERFDWITYDNEFLLLAA
jgi:hypothetical protein